ncbi:TetR/AcrR family transcriptional regulator [Ectothiorhodospiraceae bacterium WFHF3C12]|nr:TetR/AcrR family transcriptional regulator [Ectothiorhodospiraceae bacterium WFHF3C12]
MAYRRTEKMERRMARTRERIVEATMHLIARDGYAGAGIPAIAAEAGVATGSIYRFFPSKAELFDEVFRRVSQREIDACAAAAATPGTARQRIARLVETFARRALKGRRLARALLAEPVDPIIEIDRMRFREPYRAIQAGIIRDGIAAGELEEQDADVVAAGLVGAISEALVGPLGEAHAPEREEQLVATVVTLCVRSLGPAPAADEHRLTAINGESP